MLLLLMVEHLPTGDGVRASYTTDRLHDVLNGGATAVHRGNEAAGEGRFEEARRALVLVLELVVAGGTDKMPSCTLYRRKQIHIENQCTMKLN